MSPINRDIRTHPWWRVHYLVRGFTVVHLPAVALDSLEYEERRIALRQEPTPLCGAAGSFDWINALGAKAHLPCSRCDLIGGNRWREEHP